MQKVQELKRAQQGKHGPVANGVSTTGECSKSLVLTSLVGELHGCNGHIQISGCLLGKLVAGGRDQQQLRASVLQEKGKLSLSKRLSQRQQWITDNSCDLKCI